jgi:hypothetical protein
MSVSFGPGGDQYGEAVVLAPSAARAANGQAAGIGSAEYEIARLTLDVTAASGTPTLTVFIETSHDGSTWAAVASFGAKTGVSTERKVFAGLDRLVRARWTITGSTPSITFRVAGELV